MARFEVTLSDGEKILVDHPADGMDAFLLALDRNAFLILSEVKGGSSAQPVDVIVASRQVTLARPLGAQSRQGTSFRPKR